MSSPQVDRLQALLSRVQINREKPRASASSVSVSNGPSVSAATRSIAQHAQPSHSFADVSAPFVAPVVQDSIDTTPPPAAFPKPQAQPMRSSAEPMRTRPAIEAEHVRVPDLKPMRSPAQPERPMPAPARPTAPGATPLEMALEGEVARAAESAAASMPVRMEPTPSQQAAAARLEETGGRVLADPTPPQPSRPIVQAVTKHPPVQPGSFAELLSAPLRCGLGRGKPSASMLLTIDVGNTHTVLGLYDGPKLIHHFRIQSDRNRTEDESHVLLSTLVHIAGLEPADVDCSILASVVPALTDRLVRSVQRAFEHETVVVGPGIKTGMPILYENPKEVGADRIVNAIAAFERVRAGVIVVDFGTATTFDCVSNRGEYLGGVIAPGITLSAEALFARAARLPKTEIARPPHVLGRNTVHAMQSGLVFGYVGLVDGIVTRLQAEMGYPCRVLATGGEARIIAPESKTIQETDEFLTLEGLRILFERQK